ncbi:hypothetical protein IscW_ISCW023278 [Ixodes scapularis]|uniref:Uncharacterized protein n=1 Tax=Ixodes scapularis TaxID=6945 RepID=B7QJW7_IXOSC|nr:hypothetical protein IscW_ISCW023278 [Ixodes scapularis]|eukprot:XP_002415474.1 hypothetical protein IscW_ISCW023278 [Ixodes scapularis]
MTGLVGAAALAEGSRSSVGSECQAARTIHRGCQVADRALLIAQPPHNITAPATVPPSRTAAATHRRLGPTSLKEPLPTAPYYRVSRWEFQQGLVEVSRNVSWWSITPESYCKRYC